MLDQTDLSKVGGNYKVKTVWTKPRTTAPLPKKLENPAPEPEPFNPLHKYLQRNGLSTDLAGSS